MMPQLLLKKEFKDSCEELQTLLIDHGVSDINSNDLFNELVHVGSVLKNGK